MLERLDDFVDTRPYVARAPASLLFTVIALTFLLPFVSAVSDRRHGSATGVELMTGEGSLSGRYVHDVYEGEVEEFLERGRVPAAFVFIVAVAGIAVAWIPWRTGAAAAFSLAILALVGLGWLHQAVSSQYEPSVQDWHFGFLHALIAALLTVTWTLELVRATRFWWGEPEPPPRDFFAPRDTPET